MRGLAFLAGVVAILLAGCGKDSAQRSSTKSNYPLLTIEILKGIPDKDLEGAILDHIESKTANSDDEYKIITGLPKGFPIVYSTFIAEGEVNNGGFNQFFWNQSGKFQNEALAGFKTLGAAEYAALMEEAIKIHDGEAERLKQFKDKNTLPAFSESYKDDPLKPCDDKFYKLKTDLSELRVKYIREHPEEFVDK